MQRYLGQLGQAVVSGDECVGLQLSQYLARQQGIKANVISQRELGFTGAQVAVYACQVSLEKRYLDIGILLAKTR
ncbi:hypothetical protein D3C79_535760 [compost metagenome]